MFDSPSGSIPPDPSRPTPRSARRVENLQTQGCLSPLSCGTPGQLSSSSTITTLLLSEKFSPFLRIAISLTPQCLPWYELMPREGGQMVCCQHMSFGLHCLLMPTDSVLGKGDERVTRHRTQQPRRVGWFLVSSLCPLTAITSHALTMRCLRIKLNGDFSQYPFRIAYQDTSWFDQRRVRLN
ncbi:hypothetical protein LX36DRAFT_404649 [Colletotrichum falcatum]|nr:hypothetical protein LX36DRAFT_404649 [Colletotrichum falcatum]